MCFACHKYPMMCFLYDTLVWMMIVSNADISKNIFINQKQMPWYFYYYFGLTAAAAAKGRLCVFYRWKSRQGHSHKLFIENFKNSCNPLTHHSLSPSITLQAHFIIIFKNGKQNILKIEFHSLKTRREWLEMRNEEGRRWRKMAAKEIRNK